MTMYKIVRCFMHGNRKRVIIRGLTLAEAKAHCNNPETSSNTAVSPEAARRTKLHGPWFDLYDIDSKRV